jgi:cell wall-associated NlpC family hydrolase
VLSAARAQLGDPYAWGGDGPDGWDCSGLSSLWRSVGGASRLPRVSRDQQAWTVALPREQARPGDLVFFGHPVTHVGVVTGEGRMIDASESRGGVVERAIWTSGVVRYGRVPRAGMPAVRPWTPPVLPAPAPTGVVVDTPPAPDRAARGRTKAPVKAPVKAPAKAPVKAVPPARTGGTLVPLAGLPRTQARPSSRTATRFAALARAEAGRTTWTDLALVRSTWQRAGGRALPATREAIAAQGRRVDLSDARVGDLVVYNAPATHLGTYLGGGLMADASATMGRVVVRPVYTTASVRLVRLG